MPDTRAAPQTAPHNTEAERRLLGALLVQPDRLTHTRDTSLEPGDFYTPEHARIYTAILHMPDGEDPLQWCADRIRNHHDNYDRILFDLVSVVPAGVSDAALARWTGEIVETSRRRQVATALDAATREACDPDTDIADILARLTARTAQTEPAPKTLRYEWVNEATKEPPPKPDVFIDGMLSAGELGVLVAPRKTMKSWATMQMAILLARGEGLMFGELPVRKQARVLVAHGELNPAGAHDRWMYMGAADGLPAGVAQTFDRWDVRIQSRRSRSTDLSGREWTVEEHVARLDARIEQTVVDAGIDVLVIDPWAVFYSGRENSNDEMAAALEELRDLTLRTGVAIWIVHHISKVSSAEVRSPEDLWRGAGRLADWASTGVTMMPHYKTEKDWLAAGKTRKQAGHYADLFFMRRGTPTEDFSIRWDPASGWWDRWEPDPKPKKNKQENKQEVQAKTRHLNVVDVVEECRRAGGFWESIRAAAAVLGVGPDKAKRLLGSAVASGQLEWVDGVGSGKGVRLSAPTLLSSGNRFADGRPVSVYEGEQEEYDVSDWDDENLGPGS